ncbi:hypothetical protein J2Z48_003208 [Croceifilum oryzae]|uniref:Uncharacterized protein n=1 Tax=Croceifilum oryzae TaxID=1553429 RepID=A0AAJ1THI4_9BACL|nr:hypothetical protein [Croceifilum oryzae]MDQ0418983.1 hypothetical protein [Croceifilum oryzae]
MDMRLYLKAKMILFRLDEKYNLDHDGYSGMNCACKVGGDLITCKVIYGDKDTPIEREKEHIVTIEVLYGKVDMYKKHLYPGYKFTLHLASILLGEGEVLEVLD